MLCRACGNEMAAAEFCPSCNEAVLWKCSSCQKENDRSIHTIHSQDEGASGGKTASLVGTALSVVSGLYVLMPVL